jgi:amino acid adenylation domain-containing protein/non-ribosomal peptide synthase protein (TIGR01720 family)
MRVRLLQLADQDYVLSLVLHHIASDGWSRGILVREFMELYEACHEGRPARLEELPLQHADYALWQREWMQGKVLEEQMEYWKEQLAGLETLELPTDYPRPAVMSHRGAMVAMELGGELTGRIRELCRREGVTLFMALLAGVQVLLGRYTGQQEIAVGTAIANRTRREIEPLIGFFVNTLVLRGEVRSEWSWREMLQRVREVTLAAYAHQDVPFEQLVEELQPARDLSRSPLFQVMLNMQNTQQESFSLPGLSVEAGETEGVHVAKFDLTFSAEESAGKIRVGINYATELYEQATIERMAGHFRAVVEEMTRNADRRIGEVTLLSNAERTELEEWNRTEQEYPQRWVHELFEEQAAQTPDAMAVVFEERELSYAELNGRANRLAHYLRGLGVGPDTRVALCLERSPEMMVGVLGVLKAGAAYVPLDPGLPTARLAQMIEDVQVAVLITQDKLRDKLPSVWAQVISIDQDWETIAQEEADNLAINVSGDCLAYVIFTSGSTGQPKGVGITHRGLTNYLQWANDSYRIGETNQDSVSAVHSPLGFDLTVTSIFPALLAGKCISLLRPGDEINTLAEGLQKDSAYSLLKLTPSHLKVLSALLAGSGSVRGAKTLVIGGENLNYQDLSLWLKQSGEIRLINEYGPTETVVGCCVYEVSDAGAADGAVPIGKPIANTQLYVLDGHMQLVPAGAVGELFIGGAGLARGYVNQTGQTAERFVPNPFASSRGERLYRTGDRARWRSDGNLEYLGRLDQQVKIHGYRIELGEIESVLHGIAGVKQAVVIVREDVPGEKRLVAYVVGEVKERGSGQVELKGSELRRQLRERLPEYMVPSAYVQMKEIPLTGNGKVDRKRLPEPERGSHEAGYQEPQGEVEQVLAGIWKQVLRVERVGREDNFFELGGDSILSIKVVARAMEAGVEITTPQMFQQQRLRELAGVAGQRGKDPEVGGEEEEVRGELELTAIQRWFFERELEAKHHFNQALLLNVRSDVDERRLGEAVESVLKHHDAVRLRYWQEAGQWKQRYGEDRELEGIYTRIDLREVAREKRKQRMKDICGELQRSLDLERGPLARVAYFELGDGESGRLFWVMHHLIVDGVSWRILLEDVHTAWEQLGESGEVKLPGKTASLQKWVAGLKEWVESGELEKEESGYWLSLRMRTQKKLPQDYEGGRGTVVDNEQVALELGEKETGALLREAPRQYQVQIQEALLTALADAVGEWTGEDEVLVEMEGHGREAVPGGVNVTRTVGWFTSLYPVWLPVRRGMDVERRMEGVRRTLTQVPRHGIGYGLLRYFGKEELRKKLSEVPQAEISFNYLGQLDEALPEKSLFTAGGEQRGPEQDARQKRSHGLGLLASISHGKLRVVLNYSRRAHRQETIENLAANLMATLNEIASLCQNNNGPSQRRASSEVQLNDSEMRQLLSTVGIYRPTVRK